MKNHVFWLATSCMIVITARNAPSLALAQSQPENRIDWAERAVSDIQAAHEHMLANHPGPVNTADPGFLVMAERALASSLDLAAQADSVSEWQYSLMNYAAQFRDVHFSIQAQDEAGSPQPKWPGFVVAWRDGRVLIHSTEDTINFPVGAEIVSCDSKPVKGCLEDSLFRFRGNPEIAGSWTTETPTLMFDDGNPFADVPTKIELRLPGSDSVEKELRWKELSSIDDWYDRWNQAIDGPRYPISIEELPDGVWWIRLPDFQLDDTEQERFDDMIAGIEENLDSIRTGNAIILDLRRNNGGSSFHPLRVCELIWGEAHARWRESQAQRAETYVEWRASESNVATLQSYRPILEQQGWPEEQLEGFDQLIDGLSTASVLGEGLYREPDETPDPVLEEAPPRAANPVSASVFVVTTGRCASAALDAIDMFRQFEDVTLVGAATNADSNYMELRSHQLPSGNATLYCPMKVYRNRVRESGFVYQPDIRYDRLDWSDRTFKPWLLSTIEEQLGDNESD